MGMCQRLGYVDRANRGRKQQRCPVAYGGGFVLLLTWFCFAVMLTLGDVSGFWSAIFGERILLSSLVLSRPALVFGAALLGIFTLGFVDDVVPLSPSLKLFIQMMLAAWTVFVGGFQMSFFVEWTWLTAMITVLWLVFVINAFNLIDNMDGYCVLVAMVTLIFHGLAQAMTGHHLVALGTAMALGPLCAFAHFNCPPAKMYLGDAGSLSIGYFIGVLSISSTYFHEGQSLASLCLPLVMLGVPLFDVVTVMWRRYKTGAPLLVGDRRHFSHLLLEMGLTVRQVLFVMLCLSLMAGCSSLLLMRAQGHWGWLVLLQLLLCLLLVYSIGIWLRGQSHVVVPEKQ
jgi:UDP-GlcNAc:undecaprenyl-phosphate GlcNAc-1-phosphate transferase